MPEISDQSYLRNQQYKTVGNLQARIQIHRRFSANQENWFEWEYDRLGLAAGQRLLDLGCGPGEIWKTNRARLPEDLQVYLCDLSLGMSQTAALAMGPDMRFCGLAGDAQTLPFPAGSMDVVMANHMLYHVPDIRRALGDIRRVLRVGGLLAAATNGISHLAELYDFIRQEAPGFRTENDSAQRFGLENGAGQMQEYFASVQIHLYEDHLWVTEVDPLLDYIGSMWWMDQWTENLRDRFLKRISAEIQQNGGVRIQKSSGLILARA